MKKLISCYFLVFMLTMVTIGKVDVKAEEKGLNWNGFIYQIHTDTVTNDQHILIEDYVGTDKNITFPDKISGLSVTELAEKFTCTSNIVSVKISDTMLKPEGLAYCETLEKIAVDADSTRYKVIGDILYDKKVSQLLCYPSAKKDKEYVVPKTVTETYGFEQAFSNNKFLKNVTFTSVIPINSCKNSEIEKIKISGEITSVPELAFAYCKNLKTVEIGGKVDYIERDAFRGCKSLQSIKLPGDLRTIYGSAFEGTKIKKVKIPESVTYIGYDAFPSKAKITKSSYLRKVFKSGDKSRYCYKAYVIAKTQQGEKKYWARKVRKITTSNKKIKLKKGEKYQTKTSVFIYNKKKPGAIKTDILKFTSSNSKVAKVTRGGKIKALKKGTTTITVMMRTYEERLHTSRKKYKIKVRVS